MRDIDMSSDTLGTFMTVQARFGYFGKYTAVCPPTTTRSMIETGS
jgi:hypothetical protein